MKYNYHTHTVRCHHATGDDREYIEKAIEAGLEKFGFSDHAPFRYPDGFSFGSHVCVEEGEEYVQTMKKLREEYKEKIQLFIGFETEYFPTYHKEKMDFYRSLGIEYLILGNHFLFDGYPNTVYASTPTTDENLLRIFTDELIQAMETGDFSYIAHPDMFFFTGDDKAYEKQALRLCDASKANGIPLEINFLGIRTNRHYPRERFWEIAGKRNTSVVFGMDAHAPQDAGDLTSEKKAREFVEKYGLNFLEDPILRKL